ncbi:Aarf domain containing kinase 2, related [Eimeria maxima]|uniref:Aarf domain containing kinase 2, related n=1 Tax=Eimeria maxima TaxID=5804 RepID=U6M4C1_EIMMA|nr:Aarf domain containing kinase 2, related [Eimeria maxima]CDJ57299.1 Aarf domain containing kinase 2, related [Eimeria maxima]
MQLIFPVLPANVPPRLRTSLSHLDALAILERAKRSSCQDKEGFCSEVEQLINEHHFEVGHEGNSLQMSRVRLTSLMGHMLSVSKKYRVELDPSFVNIVVAMSVLEGVGAQLCPDADVLRTALPYSLMAARLLNNDSSKEA